MSRRRGRRGGGGHGEGEHDGPDERWAVSYSDMVTVLMCLFIVLYAISTVDEEKYIQLKNSLATGFGQTETSFADTATGTVVPEDLVSEDTENPTPFDLALQEVEDFTELRERISSTLVAQGLDNTVSFELDDRGLTVRLVGTQTFFDSNSNNLTPTAESVLNGIGHELAGARWEVAVEGHADFRASAAPYATNWELSAARATEVVRYLVERAGLPSSRAGAIGYGDARPLMEGESAEAMAANRRTDIVVFSDQPEDVRALFGAAQEYLIQQEAGAAPTEPAPAETHAEEASGGH